MALTRKTIWFLAGTLMNHYYTRISKLPENLQEDLFADLETAMENRLKVMESMKQ